MQSQWRSQVAKTHNESQSFFRNRDVEAITSLILSRSLGIDRGGLCLLTADVSCLQPLLADLRDSTSQLTCLFGDGGAAFGQSQVGTCLADVANQIQSTLCQSLIHASDFPFRSRNPDRPQPVCFQGHLEGIPERLVVHREQEDDFWIRQQTRLHEVRVSQATLHQDFLKRSVVPKCQDDGLFFGQPIFQRGSIRPLQPVLARTFIQRVPSAFTQSAGDVAPAMSCGCTRAAETGHEEDPTNQESQHGRRTLNGDAKPNRVPRRYYRQLCNSLLDRTCSMFRKKVISGT